MMFQSIRPVSGSILLIEAPSDEIAILKQFVGELSGATRVLAIDFVEAPKKRVTLEI
jgi:hypothetical protein